MDYKSVIVVLGGRKYGLVPLEAPTTQTPFSGKVKFLKYSLPFLEELGMRYVEDFTRLSESEILRIPGVSRKRLRDIQNALTEIGLKVGQFKLSD
jgi:DNA-directed RNA polymerase alpha subunit